MRIAVLQLAARYDALEKQLARTRELATERPADLIVLPETSLTGYVSPDGDFDLTRFAESIDGPTVQELRTIARAADAFVAAPLVERAQGAFFNACVVLDRAGSVVAKYRKRHPWFPETWATPGDEEHPAFEIDGVRTTLAICFDVHFLAEEAERTLAAADLMVFPSAWVEEDADSRPALLSDLARRFGTAIVNANWAPGDVALPGQGHSLAFDRTGRRLFEADLVEARFDISL